MTVHRDLEDLAARQLVREFPTAASPPCRRAYSNRAPSSACIGAREEKAALAQVAQTFVEPGMSVMLDDSTTVLNSPAL